MSSQVLIFHEWENWVVRNLIDVGEGGWNDELGLLGQPRKNLQGLWWWWLWLGQWGAIIHTLCLWQKSHGGEEGEKVFNFFHRSDFFLIQPHARLLLVTSGFGASILEEKLQEKRKICQLKDSAAWALAAPGQLTLCSCGSSSGLPPPPAAWQLGAAPPLDGRWCFLCRRSPSCCWATTKAWAPHSDPAILPD